jgi:hypothetical protein
MRGMYILLVAILFATGASAEPDGGADKRIEIRNRAVTKVYNVYIAEAKGVWGQDRLRAETMISGEMKVLFVTDETGVCHIDIKAVFEDRAISLGYDIDVCGDQLRFDIIEGSVIAAAF